MQRLSDLLRASRFLLGLKQADVEEECKFSARTVLKLEAGKHVRLPRTALTLKSFYEAKGVEFIDAVDGHGSGIRWKAPDLADPVRSKLFRAARGLVFMSQKDVAVHAGIDETFIKRLEKDALKRINEATLQKLRKFLQEQNVEITPEGKSHGGGVRLIVGDVQATPLGQRAVPHDGND